jgi:guanosine-3',5'-bis(diphosphate) 3'-pyrophosphohydrolase
MGERLPFHDQSIEDARAMAEFAHGDQKYGEHPYVWHLDEVAQLCEQYGTKATIVAFLHDAIEDTSLSPKTIEDRFGSEIRQLVEALTDPPGKNRKERKKESCFKLGSITATSPMATALIVKAADRLANVRACVADGKTGLLEMYRSEHPMFRRAVFRSRLNDDLIVEIDHLLASLQASAGKEDG